MIILLFLLITYGISNIMIFSSIFKWWREFWMRVSPNFFGELFTCMICLPFWIGDLLSFLGVSPFSHYYTADYLGVSMFLDSCLASGGVWLIHTLQEKLEK